MHLGIWRKTIPDRTHLCHPREGGDPSLRYYGLNVWMVPASAGMTKLGPMIGIS